jgi:hypothetical protein
MKKCAICWVDPDTGRRGTNDTTWICHDCRKHKIGGKYVNEGWGIHPTEESQLDDAEVIPSTVETPKPDSNPGKYETSTAILVMRLYCMDVGTQRAIADMAGCSQGFVSKVITHWENNYGHTVSKLKEFFKTRVMV